MSSDGPPTGLTRRAFLGVGGGAIVWLAGCSLTPWPSLSVPAARGRTALAAWIAITADSDVVVLVDKCEMGQGVRDLFATIVAEELGLPLDRILTDDAPVDATVYANRGFPSAPIFQITGYSSSTKDAWKKLRTVAAGVRELLVSRAAMRLSISQAEVQIVPRAARERSGAMRQLPLAELVRDRPRAADGVPKSSGFTLVGAPTLPAGTPRPARIDAVDKVTGRARYGIDVDERELGQKPLIALIVRPPCPGDAIEIANQSEIESMRGVNAVLALGGGHGGIAIVADSFWRAEKARRSVRTSRRPAARERSCSQAVLDTYRAVVAQAGTSTNGAAPDDGTSRGLTSAVYQTPFGPHTALEPLSAACVSDEQGFYHIHAATQFPQAARGRAAVALGVATHRVVIHGMLAGGSFGRRVASDYIAEVAEICGKLGGRAVKLMWTREDEFRHDWLRPAAVSGVSARVEDGRIARWDHQLVSESANIGLIGEYVSTVPLLRRVIGARPGWQRLTLPGGVDAIDPTLREGVGDTVYTFRPDVHVHRVPCRSGIRLGYWRSVGFFHTVFAVESAMDELAAAAKRNPLAFRLDHLAEPRAQWCLTTLRDTVGLDKFGSAGMGYGLACFSGWGSYAALAVRVTIEGAEIRVRQAWAAVDCGFVVSPDIVRQQIEGGIIFGLSAALKQDITLVDGVVQEVNFHACDVLRMNECPAIHVELRTHEPTTAPGGVGELMVPLPAPAVANALFNLTKVPPRRLPLSAAGLRA